MIGKTLKGYEIVEKIKEGSVGTVWLARNSKGQEFALKQISHRNSTLGRKIRAFKSEASITGKLSHPYIIKVYEYVAMKPQPFFVMEYFQSENLKFAMKHLPEPVQTNEFYILRQIAEALAHIHAMGVIHRDVKPENVLVSSDAEVRLIDFSLAQGKWRQRIPFLHRREGTPVYMAPEQIRGKKCDARTDIYSFGVLMYELLAKRPPFAATTERQVLEKHIQEAPLPMREAIQTVSKDLEDVVLKMLSKRPENRFQDMTSVIYELSKWERKRTIVRMRQVEPIAPKEGAGALKSEGREAAEAAQTDRELAKRMEDARRHLQEQRPASDEEKAAEADPADEESSL